LQVKEIAYASYIGLYLKDKIYFLVVFDNLIKAANILMIKLF